MKEENPQHMARRVSPISWATTTQRIKVLSQQVTTVRFLLLGYFNWCKRFRYNLGWIARRSIASDAQLMLSENQSFLETFISSYLIGIEVGVQIFYKMDIQSFDTKIASLFLSLSLSTLLFSKYGTTYHWRFFWILRYACLLFESNA